MSKDITTLLIDKLYKVTQEECKRQGVDYTSIMPKSVSKFGDELVIIDFKVMKDKDWKHTFLYGCQGVNKLKGMNVVDLELDIRQCQDSKWYEVDVLSYTEAYLNKI